MPAASGAKQRNRRNFFIPCCRRGRQAAYGNCTRVGRCFSTWQERL